MAQKPHIAPPRFIEPPAASKDRRQSPRGDSWAHEVKYDGYRMAARIADGKARLLTRHGVDWTKRYPAMSSALGAQAERSTMALREMRAVDACCRAINRARNEVG